MSSISNISSLRDLCKSGMQPNTFKLTLSLARYPVTLSGCYATNPLYEGAFTMTFLRRYAAFTPILLIPVLVFAVWLFPAYGMVLLIISLSFGLFVSSLMIIKKHRETYLHGKISRAVFLRNVCLHLSAIVITMLASALIGDYLGKVATRQMTDDLTKFIAGIFVGLLVGITIGFFVQRIGRKLVLRESS